jgi:aspartate aminotransferase
VPTSAWTSYYEMVSLARARAVPVRGRRERDFKVTAAELEAAATPRTKGIILNSPCNPTGAVYSGAELRSILELADRRDWWVISDEIYRRLVFGDAAATAFELSPRRDRLVVVDGMAKAYAMPGWRVGWAVTPRPVAQMMSALQSHSTSGASAPAQQAALAALRQRDASDAAIAAMVEDLDRRRRAAVALLRDAGDVEFIEPEGALYLFIRVGVQDAAGDDPAAAFATRLLEEGNVAVVPGAAFLTPEWVRASFAAPESEVLAGLGRLVRQLHASRRVGGAATGRASSLV